MEGYVYPYPPGYSPVHPEVEYPDHGDGFGDYYVTPLNAAPLNDDPSKRSTLFHGGWPTAAYAGHCGEPWASYHPYNYWKWMPPPMLPPVLPPKYELEERPSCSKYHTRKPGRRSRSRDSTRSKSKSRSRSRSRSKSRSHSKSRSRSGSQSRTHSASPHRELTYKEPTLLDSFRVLYLSPSKHKKSTTKYLVTKKKQDRIQELLKNDGLGSKRWLFYPRVHEQREPATGQVPGARDNIDQRIKVDGDFFRKYKRSKKVDPESPITKLKRWELVLYKKLGFVQAV